MNHGYFLWQFVIVPLFLQLAKRAELMKKSLEQQEAELNEKREAFLQEKSAWEAIHKQAENDQV